MKSCLLSMAEFDMEATESRSMSELDRAFQKFANATGFTNYSAVLVQPPRNGEPVRYIGRPVMEWAQRYVEKDYASIDAVIRRLRHSDEAVWWSHFSSSSRLEAPERNMFGEAAEIGIVEGLSTAVRLARGHVWMCAATTPEKKMQRGIENAFQYSFSLYVREAYRFQSFAQKGEGLTPKEREIVLLLAEGNTQREAAAILGKSERTVYNQIAAAKDRLGVENVMGLLAFL